MEQAGNTFTEGLNKDLHPIATPNNVLTDALNATLITFNGNELLLLNDMGNTNLTYYPRTWKSIEDEKNNLTDYKSVAEKIKEKVKLKDNYIPIGIKEHGDIIYIISYNPIEGRTEIGSFPGPEYRPFDKEISENITPKIIEIKSQEDLNKIYPITDFDSFDKFLKPRDKIILNYLAAHTRELINLNNIISQLNDLNLISDENHRRLFKLKILNTVKNSDLSNSLNLDFSHGDHKDVSIFYPNTATGNLGIKIDLEDIDDFYTTNYPIIETKEFPTKDDPKHIIIKLLLLYIKHVAEYLKVNKLYWSYKLKYKDSPDYIYDESYYININDQYLEDDTLKINLASYINLKNVDYLETLNPDEYEQYIDHEYGPNKPEDYLVIPLIKNSINKNFIIELELWPETNTYIGDDEKPVNLDKYKIKIIYDLSKSVDLLLGEATEEIKTINITLSINNFKFVELDKDQNKIIKHSNEIPYKNLVLKLFKKEDEFKYDKQYTYYINNDNDKETLIDGNIIINDDVYFPKNFVTELAWKNELGSRFPVAQNGMIFYKFTQPDFLTNFSYKLNSILYKTTKSDKFSTLLFATEKEKDSSGLVKKNCYIYSAELLHNHVFIETNLLNLIDFNLKIITTLDENNSLNILRAGGHTIKGGTTAPSTSRTNECTIQIANYDQDNKLKINSNYKESISSLTSPKGINGIYVNSDSTVPTGYSNIITQDGKNLINIDCYLNKSDKNEIYSIKYNNKKLFYEILQISPSNYLDPDTATRYIDFIACPSMGIGSEKKKEIGISIEYLFNDYAESAKNFDETNIKVTYTLSQLNYNKKLYYLNKNGSRLLGYSNIFDLKNLNKINNYEKNNQLNLFDITEFNSNKMSIPGYNSWKIFSCYLSKNSSVEIISNNYFYIPNNDTETLDICELKEQNFIKETKITNNTPKFKRITILYKSSSLNFLSIKSDQLNKPIIYNPIIYDPIFYIDPENSKNIDKCIETYIDNNKNELHNDLTIYCSNFSAPVIKLLNYDIDNKEYYIQDLTNTTTSVSNFWLPLPIYDIDNINSK